MEETHAKIDFSKTNDHPAHSRSRLSFGQKAADQVTLRLGSWSFIIFFIIFLFSWIAINIALKTRSWDPFPFILLNLTLSTLASFQAPIILMSQKRQGERDRIRSEYDYIVDRKAEREIRELKAEISEIKQILLKKGN